MTSRATHQSAVDDALIAKYTGISITVDGVVTPVEVFLEEPNPVAVKNRVYPSISIQYVGEVEDYESSESTDDEMEERELNTAVFPYERAMRAAPEPVRLQYYIDTWHKDMQLEERELVRKVYRRLTKARGYLTANNIDGVPIDLYMFRVTGSFDSRNETDTDTIIYHKTLLVEVLVHLSEVDYDETVSERVAMELHWDVKSRKSLWNEKGQIESNVDGKDVTDVSIRITEDGEEILP